MKGHVYKRGKKWSYLFDIDPDPLTGKRQQANGSGFATEREAWKQCRAAMKEYEEGHRVEPSKRRIEEALNTWLERIQHAVKPSMWQNWRDYADYYVIPHIGQRNVQDIDGAVLDALYAKLLADGRRRGDGNLKMYQRWRKEPNVKASDLAQTCDVTIHAARAALRRYRAGRVPQYQSNGLSEKTVVNTHRMLHRAWEDFVTWKWAHRNVAKDAHAPTVPRKGRKVWNVEQLRTFLHLARTDRFYALWVLEATSGMRRCELAGAGRDGLDLAAGTLTIETTRVVVDGKVIESDGKTENAQRVLALDPFTLAALTVHVGTLDLERAEFGPDYEDSGLLFCWENGKPPHPDTITRRFKRLAASAGLPEIDLHDVRHSYATAGRDAKIDWKALSARIGHADVAFTMKQYVQTDLAADRQVANTLAELILGGTLASVEVTKIMDMAAKGTDQGEAA
jgi:integrase